MPARSANSHPASKVCSTFFWKVPSRRVRSVQSLSRSLYKILCWTVSVPARMIAYNTIRFSLQCRTNKHACCTQWSRCMHAKPSSCHPACMRTKQCRECCVSRCITAYSAARCRNRHEASFGQTQLITLQSLHPPAAVPQGHNRSLWCLSAVLAAAHPACCMLLAARLPVQTTMPCSQPCSKVLGIFYFYLSL